jgi:hypothetical protein
MERSPEPVETRERRPGAALAPPLAGASAPGEAIACDQDPDDTDAGAIPVPHRTGRTTGQPTPRVSCAPVHTATGEVPTG